MTRANSNNASAETAQNERLATAEAEGGKQDSDNEDDEEGLLEGVQLLEEGDNFAVFAAGESPGSEDFFLVKCLQPMHWLHEAQEDPDGGSCFQPGDTVVTGQYYVRHKGSDMEYTLETGVGSKHCIVDTKSVLFTNVEVIPHPVGERGGCRWRLTTEQLASIRKAVSEGRHAVDA